jgi:hypothetical protein
MKSLMSMPINNISILLPLYSYESVLSSDTFLYEVTGYSNSYFNRN